MALPKLDGELVGRMASTSSSFPLQVTSKSSFPLQANKKALPSASFPLASNSYDWILQDSRAKASTSGEQERSKEFWPKLKGGRYKSLVSCFLVSSSVSPPSSDLSSADTSLPKMDPNFSQVRNQSS